MIGDVVDVVFDVVEDGFGEICLFCEKVKCVEVWKVFEKFFEVEEVVKGIINGKVKGGFIVDLVGICVFLSGFLVDVCLVCDIVYLENKEFEFKVIKLD